MVRKCNDLPAMPHAEGKFSSPAHVEMPSESTPPPSFIVIAPTLNNARTIEAILVELRSQNLQLIVVNDGCTDETPAILSRLQSEFGSAMRIITHPSNRGKAAALRSGFDLARMHDFTHAITIDTDGQHDPADVDPLIECAKLSPDALVVGYRSISNGDYPAKSKIGRAISNQLIAWECGIRVIDSQCGLRIYPLDPLRQLHAGSARFGFETEIITRFAWSGSKIIETPVRCIYALPGGRTTHFRPLRDSISAVVMHTWLMLRAIHFSPPTRIGNGERGSTIFQRFTRWLNPMNAFQQARAGREGQSRVAAAMALGIAVAALPPLGYKTVLCLLLSRWLKLQPAIVIAVASLNTPPTGPILAALSIMTGHLVLHGSVPTLSHYDPARLGWLAVFKSVGGEWLLGSAIVGAILAAIVYVIATIILRRAITTTGTRPATLHTFRSTAFQPVHLPDETIGTG